LHIINFGEVTQYLRNTRIICGFWAIYRWLIVPSAR
jgi:hypothetical protein